MSIETARSAIEQAKRYLDTDPHMANYVLRDLPETKAADLSDWAWAAHKSGNVHRNDVLGLIEYLEEYLDKQSKGATR